MAKVETKKVTLKPEELNQAFKEAEKLRTAAAKVEEPILPKADEPKADEPKADEPKADEPKVPNFYVSTGVRHSNPYTGDVFNPGEPIPATEDNWLECQVKAGLIKLWT